MRTLRLTWLVCLSTLHGTRAVCTDEPGLRPNLDYWSCVDSASYCYDALWGLRVQAECLATCGLCVPPSAPPLPSSLPLSPSPPSPPSPPLVPWTPSKPSMPLLMPSLPPGSRQVRPGESLQDVLVSSAAGAVILLADGTYTGATTFHHPYTGTTEAVLHIEKDVVLRALNPGRAVIDGERVRRILNIDRAASVALIGLHLTRGFAISATALSVGSGSRVTAVNCTVSHMSASSSSGDVAGGVMFLYPNAIAILTGCTITNCAATSSPPWGWYVNGGMIFLLFNATVTLVDCTIARFDAAAQGDVNGGVMYLDVDATATLISTSITDSTATSRDGTVFGGVLYFHTNTVARLTGCRVSRITAGSNTSGASSGDVLGGIMRLNTNASVTLTDSVLTDVSATAIAGRLARGGCIYATNAASIWLVGTLLQRCSAISAEGAGGAGEGGAAFLGSAARLELSHRTALLGNRASTAGSTLLITSASAVAVLPAPTGRWIAGSHCIVRRRACPRDKHYELREAACGAAEEACTRLPAANASFDGTPCQPLEVFQHCDWFTYPHLVNQVIEALPQGRLDVDYPRSCSAGLIGSDDPGFQSTSLCAGLAPAGTYQPHVLGVEARPCPSGGYCEGGGSQPLSCPQGTWQPHQNVSSAEGCLPCQPGFWCTAGERIGCKRGFYNPSTNAASQTACVPCPPQSNTRTAASTHVEDCRCDAHFFRPNVSLGVVECEPCGVGFDCPTAGTTLQTLMTWPGYWRPSALSLDVRRCPDAGTKCALGLSGHRCNESSLSGCTGGTRPCRPGLGGPFCQLCDSGDNASAAHHRVHYRIADGAKPSRCVDCSETLLFTTWLVVSVAAGLGLAACGVVQLEASYRPLARLRARLLRACRTYAIGNKLKISAGFFMIAAQFESVYEVQLPADVRRVYEAMGRVLSLGLEIDTTSLDCIGFEGYYWQLVFWILLPILLLLCVVLAAGIHLATRSPRPKMTAARLLSAAAPASLRLLFLVYPIVTTKAFAAFSWYRFYDDDVAWLRADVSIRRGSRDHADARAIAITAILLYPASIWIFFAVLLVRARHAILSGRPSTLSETIAFLHCEYQPGCFAWELVEMARRLILVGVFLVRPGQGTVEQLAYATLVAVCFLAFQARVAPYVHPSDNLLADFYSLLLAACFIIAVFFKLFELTDLELLQQLMSEEQKRDFHPPIETLSAILSATSVGAFAILAAIVFAQLAAERRRRRREEAANLPTCDWLMAAGQDYACFLSHFKREAGAEARYLKDALDKMLGGNPSYLDSSTLADLRQLLTSGVANSEVRVRVRVTTAPDQRRGPLGGSSSPQGTAHPNPHPSHLTL